jgi:hypothetical protein
MMLFRPVVIPAPFVIPAEAGSQTRRSSKEAKHQRLWIPALAGMTEWVG